MKKLIMMAVMLMVASSAFAHSPIYSIPSEAYVDNDTTRQEFGYGVGADVVVYEPGHPLAEEVRVDTRYDVENRETRIFAVVKVNLFEYLASK